MSELFKSGDPQSDVLQVELQDAKSSGDAARIAQAVDAVARYSSEKLRAAQSKYMNNFLQGIMKG